MANNTLAVAFLGPISSFSHQVTRNHFPDSQYDFKPQKTIQGCFSSSFSSQVTQLFVTDVFEAIQSGSAMYGVIPFENSTSGFIANTVDLLTDLGKGYDSVFVSGEVFLDVHHCLIGHKTSREFRTTDVQHIYSHAQAFAQCETYLSTYHKSVKKVEVSSTSEAAKLVQADKSGTIAAIASRNAAEVFDLDILVENIEDCGDNSTRFLILKRGWEDKDALNRLHDVSKGLVSFTLDNQVSGVLANALMVFKEQELHLTNILSRPSRQTQWHYIFLVEFELRNTRKNYKLDRLDVYTDQWRIRGFWKHSIRG